MSSVTLTPPTCSVVIVNDVLGTRQEFDLPETVDEAMENCLLLSTAKLFAGWESEPDERPIAVAIQKGQDTIRVHWYVVADLDSARAAMIDVESGAWRGGLLQ